MPKSLSVPSSSYAPGTYGPFALDSFVSANTDLLRLALTVENWPDASPLLTGQIRWDTGDGVDFSINSPPFDRRGNPLSEAVITVGVPQNAAGKAAVRGAALTVIVMQTMTTAVSFSAEQT